MKNLLLIFAFLTAAGAFSQGVVVNGNVLDGEFNNEPLAFANVRVKGVDISAETSIFGDFELLLLDGKYDLVVEFVGYAPVEIDDVLVSGKKVSLKPVILKAYQTEFDLASSYKEMSLDKKTE